MSGIKMGDDGKSGISIKQQKTVVLVKLPDEKLVGMRALPCDCGDKSCKGWVWQMVSQ